MVFSVKLFFLFFFILQVSSEKENPCGENGWIPFENLKCFKLIKRYASQDQAEEMCQNEESNLVQISINPFASSLASIKSQKEQNFLNEYLFQTEQVKVNIWTSGKRFNNEFIWWDNSTFDYTNWSPNSPSNNADRGCVSIESGLLFNSGGGKWRDQSCEAGNYVLCEKLQRWSLEEIQYNFLVTLKNLQEQLDKADQQLIETKDEMNTLKQNPVPIGFIYTQLSGQPAPATIWPTTQWQEISSNYAGHFFRVLGGDSASFGTLQSGNAPRLIGVRTSSTTTPHSGYDEYISIYAGQTSSSITSGTDYNSNRHWRFMNRFQMSGGEVRPINQAVRLWKRSG